MAGSDLILAILASVPWLQIMRRSALEDFDAGTMTPKHGWRVQVFERGGKMVAHISRGGKRICDVGCYTTQQLKTGRMISLELIDAPDDLARLIGLRDQFILEDGEAAIIFEPRAIMHVPEQRTASMRGFVMAWQRIHTQAPVE
ncbi:hypothetical protein V8J36_05465 [Frigidibacter sp. MR17.14]|uniref:hypothetical protein n=1 Tax=Frigidibacter sp. MR17.14 TaxID=3126509 RepID=UPI0030130A99